jgi:hypothetical protein
VAARLTVKNSDDFACTGPGSLEREKYQ